MIKHLKKQSKDRKDSYWLTIQMFKAMVSWFHCYEMRQIGQCGRSGSHFVVAGK
jgi:hypothetical protein